MKNALKATLGVLLFSGLFLFNLSNSSSNESFDLPTISVEQTIAHAGVSAGDGGDGTRDPHSHIGEATLCYNQVPLACDTNGGVDPAPAPDPVVVANN